MAKTNYSIIDDYHQGFSGLALERLNLIRMIVNEIVPEAEECISYQIPCFKYKGYLIYYAAFEKHISLSRPFSTEFLKYFSNDLKDYKVSKAAIQFPLAADFPERFVRDIIKFCRIEQEQKAPKNKTKKT